MNTTNIFEVASRKGYRYKTSQGNITTEDLWTLSLDSLNKVAITVHKTIKEKEEISFIDTQTSADKDEEMKLDILKYIIEFKKNKAALQKKRQERLSELQTLKSIMAEKKLQEMNSTSMEDLQKRITELTTEIQED